MTGRTVVDDDGNVGEVSGPFSPAATPAARNPRAAVTPELSALTVPPLALSAP